MATGARQHKFGVAIDRALGIYRRAQHSPHLRISGIACHIGSQIVSIEPFIRALTRLKEIFLILRSQDIGVRSIDLGGGLGIVYDNESAPDPAAYARAVRSVIRDLDCTLLIEPGRVIVGNAGILVTRVMLTKQSGARNFVVVDAGMNDLIRPSLYGAYHRILPVVRSRRRVRQVDVVGPVCESGDFLALGRRIPGVRAGELLAVMSAGAYSFVLSSHYNSRRRPAEVLARGGRFKIIRSRERLGDLTRGESRRPL
jgi:diaminopimelate decarboxylase